MMNHVERQLLRGEIAVAAARLIAQDGADYASAKRKAARHILGDAETGAAAVLPDNAMIEAEVRRYQALFMGATQPARLLALRRVALAVMEMLQPFEPYLTGAVCNGTAGQDSDIYLQVFADSAKEVEIFLLNQNIQLTMSSTPHFKGVRYAPVETASFMWQQEAIHAALYEADDVRGARKLKPDGSAVRTDRAGLRALLLHTVI